MSMQVMFSVRIQATGEGVTNTISELMLID